jgi:hypothetical protein
MKVNSESGGKTPPNSRPRYQMQVSGHLYSPGALNVRPGWIQDQSGRGIEQKIHPHDGYWTPAIHQLPSHRLDNINLYAYLLATHVECKWIAYRETAIQTLHIFTFLTTPGDKAAGAWSWPLTSN